MRKRQFLSHAAKALGITLLGPIFTGQKAMAATWQKINSTTGAAGTWQKLKLTAPGSGTVVAWGVNWSGQLGDNTFDVSSGGGWVGTVCKNRPVKVCCITNAIALAKGGDDNTLALISDGTVKSWGWNAMGQLGDGTITDRSMPVTVCGVSTAVAVENAMDSSYAILSNGCVMSWGQDLVGSLGLGASGGDKCIPQLMCCISTATAMSGGHFSALVLRGNGSARLVGGGNPMPIAVTGISNATAVAHPITAGYPHWLYLIADGTVKAWAGIDGNQDGRLGDGTATTTCPGAPVTVCCITNAIAIANGANFSLALLSSGQIMSWGANGCGQLGDNTLVSKCTPVFVCGISTALAIASGVEFSLALLANGTVKAWGSNVEGQLGDGTFTTRCTPVSVCDISNAIALGSAWSTAYAILSGG